MHRRFLSLLVPSSFALALLLTTCGLEFRDQAETEQPTPTTMPSPTPEPTPTVTPTPTPSPTPTPTPTPTATPTPEPTPTPTATTADLDGYVLELADLESEWMAIDVDSHPTEVPGTDEIESALASAFFQQDDLGPFLGHMLLVAESESDARVAFAAVEEELGEADILDGISDQVLEWETRPLVFPDHGDESFAYRAIGETGLVPVVADMVTTRQGRYVSLVIYAQVLSVDSEQTEEFVGMALDKLPE